VISLSLSQLISLLLYCLSPVQPRRRVTEWLVGHLASSPGQSTPAGQTVTSKLQGEGKDTKREDRKMLSMNEKLGIFSKITGIFPHFKSKKTV